MERISLAKRYDNYWLIEDPNGAVSNVLANVIGRKDSTKAIMDALLERKRCAEGCNGSTKRNAIVYFPPGTYLVSSTIEIPFGTQLIGDVSPSQAHTVDVWPLHYKPATAD